MRSVDDRREELGQLRRMRVVSILEGVTLLLLLVLPCR